MSVLRFEGQAEDPLDLVGALYGTGHDTLALERHQLPEGFFDLKSGVAGEYLQKLTNYRKRLIVAGDFSELTSKAWKDFMRESNRGGQVVFAPTVEDGEKQIRG